MIQVGMFALPSCVLKELRDPSFTYFERKVFKGPTCVAFALFFGGREMTF
ncbi:hypothetical protein Sjap_002750 [Stephania japonica]|uniref:Uncharacterized protein n=1 Tax=Stephania japonica TaxID=461633 RepID=A0AAP0KNC6_9MAGN